MKGKACKVVDVAKTIHNITESELFLLRQHLLNWYHQKKRDLPWRKLAKQENRNDRGYAVWVSEIMLQQTQVATVIAYYNKWMTKWPTLQDLAKSNLEEVNEMWSGLGYYSRAKRLHEGAQKVVEKLSGEMPRNAEELLNELSGVGKYTAGAIASIAFNERTGIVDGNVIRVMTRLRAIGADSAKQTVTDAIWYLANTSVDPESPGDFNQGIMELGATVCTPKDPSCYKCPVNDMCYAYKMVNDEKKYTESRLLGKKSENKTNICDIEDCALCLPSTEPWNSELGVTNFPRKAKKKPPRQELALVCILHRHSKELGDQYLIKQRPPTGLLAGLWEFLSLDMASPSDSKPKEQKKELAKSIFDQSEIKVDVSRLYHLGEVVHIFSHIHQTYSVHTTTIKEEDHSCSNSSGQDTSFRWVTAEEFAEAAVSTAMKKVFKLITSKENAGVILTGKGVKRKRSIGPVDKKQTALESFFKKK